MSSEPGRDSGTRLDPLLFRRTCACFATGVTIVTGLDSEGRPHGMTVNSFTSVSLDPPLVLVSIDVRNSMLNHYLSGNFGINILASDQQDLSHRFANEPDRFQGVDWQPGKTGVPLLTGVLAWFECAVTGNFQAGDHTIVIGEVLRVSQREGDPLVFYNSGYRDLR